MGNFQVFLVILCRRNWVQHVQRVISRSFAIVCKPKLAGQAVFQKLGNSRSANTISCRGGLFRVSGFFSKFAWMTFENHFSNFSPQQCLKARRKLELNPTDSFCLVFRVDFLAFLTSEMGQNRIHAIGNFTLDTTVSVSGTYNVGECLKFFFRKVT